MFSRKVNEISLHSHPWHLQPILHTEAKVIFKKNWNLLLSLPMLGGLQWIPSSGEGLEGILQSLLGLQPMFSTWLTRLYTIWPSFTSSFHLTTSFLLLSRFYLHCLLSGAQCTVLLLISEPLYMLFLYPRMLFPLYFLTLTSCGRLSNDLSPAPKDVHVLNSRSCEYVILHSKGDFTDAIKDLGTERLLSLSRWNPV